MSRVTGIVSSSGEDFIDELSSTLTYQYANQIFAPTVNKLGQSDSVVDNALSGALTTLQYGIMNLVIMSVTEYAITKTSLVAGSIFVYLKATNVAKKTKGVIAGALGSIPFVGRGLGNIVMSVGSFVTKDRELVAKMAMDSSNNLTTVISQERQNQILIKNQKYKKIDTTVDRAVNIRGHSRTKNMDLYMHNFKTGSWKKTQKHKKLYEDCTGQKMGENGLTWNANFVQKLNSYSEFAISSEGQIFSNAKATLDLLNVAGSATMR